MNRYLERLLSLPKSLWVNQSAFGLKGLRLPVMVRFDVALEGLAKNSIEIKDSRFSSIQIGFGGTDSIQSKRPCLNLKKGSLLKFSGKAQFSRGVRIKNKGVIAFGNNFHANKNCSISCTERIVFGDNDLLGWNVSLRDSDGHVIRPKNRPLNDNSKTVAKNVIIGNHVWIASECHILRGTAIPDDCVVGYRSLVNKSFTERNTIIAGQPAAIVKRDIEWEL